MSTIHFAGATLADGTRADVLVVDGTISDIGSVSAPSGAERVDAGGLLLLPGLVDLHSHLREPGFEQSETVLTGSQAGARGGYTTLFAMANTSPVADTAGVVEQVWRLGREAGYTRVQPIGAVTRGLAGEQLAEIGAMAASRAEVRVFSDDGMCVWDPRLMRRALEYVKAFGGVVAQHAQEPRLTEGAQMNESALSAELGLPGWPSVAEEAIIARDALLAETTGSRLHVCHLSTAGAVDVVRWAKRRGISITAEVTPHHLLLTEQHVASFDPRFKVNPPLRGNEDVQALREAVADGTIDIIATDHAPHPVESKECEWASAANGMVGLESALSVAQRSLVDEGFANWVDISRLMSLAPARIGGLTEAGELTVGAVADLVLYDPSVSRTFATTDLAGKSQNSPYLGVELPGNVVATMRLGYFTVRDSVLQPEDEVARQARGGFRG
ncbi:MAG TPA: dihydroorotase [Microbacteriaceae bacterium]|nr:dihydroorotase [Microbacteriaceae bacterium]